VGEGQKIWECLISFDDLLGGVPEEKKWLQLSKPGAVAALRKDMKRHRKAEAALKKQAMKDAKKREKKQRRMDKKKAFAAETPNFAVTNARPGTPGSNSDEPGSPGGSRPGTPSKIPGNSKALTPLARSSPPGGAGGGADPAQSAARSLMAKGGALGGTKAMSRWKVGISVAKEVVKIQREVALSPSVCVSMQLVGGPEKNLPAGCAVVALVNDNLSVLYRKHQVLRKAELCAMRGLAIRENVLGPDHPLTAVSCNNLASIYKALFRFDECKLMLERAISIRSRLIGPDHPSTATLLSNLAQLYHHCYSDLNKAEQVFLRVLKIREGYYGTKHRLTLMTLNYLACVFRDQQRFDQVGVTVGWGGHTRGRDEGKR
jgi:hypothetical protein